jgi:hypothetical protein
MITQKKPKKTGFEKSLGIPIFRIPVLNAINETKPKKNLVFLNLDICSRLTQISTISF